MKSEEVGGEASEPDRVVRALSSSAYEAEEVERALTLIKDGAERGRRWRRERRKAEAMEGWW